MKKCPFCEFENEDSANTCIFCGGELQLKEANCSSTSAVDSEGAFYSVLMLPNKYKNAVKTVQAFF